MKIAKIFGIPLYLDWTWFLFVGLIIFLGMSSLFLLAFLFIILHEYGHCLAAKYLGLEVDSITLYPIGGVAKIYFEGTDPGPEFLITIAGPSVNIILALIFVFIPYCELIVAINLVLGIMNLVPCFPMDGGRIMRAALLWGLNDYRMATYITVRIGQVIALCMVGIGVYFSLFMWIIVFGTMFFAGQAELVAIKQQESAREVDN